MSGRVSDAGLCPVIVEAQTICQNKIIGGST